MQAQATTAREVEPRPELAAARDQWRSIQREKALQSALRKRALGVPTYTVPEAAALLSRSQEHLYRQIKANAFPAVDMGGRGRRGYYVVPAKALDAMLDAATASGSVVSAADFCAAGGFR